MRFLIMIMTASNLGHVLSPEDSSQMPFLDVKKKRGWGHMPLFEHKLTHDYVRRPCAIF